MQFEKKELQETKRICMRLKEAREKRNKSLDFVAKKMKISKKWIQALEECRFDDIPFAPIYKKNLVRGYAKALSINPEPYVKQFEHEEEPLQITLSTPPIKTSRKNWNSNTPALLRSLSIIVIILAIAGYLGYEIQNILRPPTLTIFTPQEGHIAYESPIHLKGQTEKEVQISINGKETKTSAEGIFEEEIDLRMGINTIIISAEKKHGKITTETRHVTLRTAPQDDANIGIQPSTSTPKQ